MQTSITRHSGLKTIGILHRLIDQEKTPRPERQIERQVVVRDRLRQVVVILGVHVRSVVIRDVSGDCHMGTTTESSAGLLPTMRMEHTHLCSRKADACSLHKLPTSFPKMTTRTCGCYYNVARNDRKHDGAGGETR